MFTLFPPCFRVGRRLHISEHIFLLFEIHFLFFKVKLQKQKKEELLKANISLNQYFRYVYVSKGY